MIVVKRYIKILFPILLFIISANHLQAQDCDSNYFSIIYKSADYIDFSKSITTQDTSILCLENNYYYPPGLVKFTPQGNVIWTYNYSAPFAANGNHPWTDLFFTDVATGLDGSFFVTGSVTKHGLFFDNTEIPPPKTVAVLMKADKYGKVLWSKFFFSQNSDAVTLTRVITTNDGNAICYMAFNNGHISYGKIVCFLPDGNIKWVTNLNTGIFNCAKVAASIKRSIKQTRNGNIVVADVVYDSSLTAEFHFFSLNSNTGAMVWETSYGYPLYYLAKIDHIAELPGGDLSFQTSLIISTPNHQQPTQKHVNIITDSKGSIQNIFAYYPAGNPYFTTVDANDDGDNGNQTILMADTSSKAILMQINEEGQINWSKKYGYASAGLPPVCFSINREGYNIFMSEFTVTTQLLRTDPAANLDCDTTPVQMIKEETKLSGNVNNISTDTSPQSDAEPFGAGFFVMLAGPASPFTKIIDCQKNIPCCIDVIDTAHTQNISLCEGSTYTLPDNTLVKDSGTYYISYKTSRGCDSVSYYKINLLKNPADLMLVTDTCFAANDSIVLQATDGYDNYNWMNFPPAKSSSYPVYQPGNYYVSVTNICGTKTDTAHLYSVCDFPVYMPTAFTPNGDYLNDVFRVSPLNKNHLVRLLIYNRFGQLVFATNNIKKGWDGTINNIPQPIGIYVYYLEMKGLTGKKINQKGSFVLIR